MLDLEPVPQTPLRDDPGQDAIWKRWLQSFQIGNNATGANVSALSVQVSVVRAGFNNELSVRALSVNVLSAVVSVNAVQVSALSVAVSVVAANLSNELSVRALSVNALSAVVSVNAAKVSNLSVINGALLVSAVLTLGAPGKLKGYAVSTLPSGVQGYVAFCTDLLAPTFMANAVGGGAIVGVVFYNGVNWVSF
jgi:hypothetical protein